MDTCKFVKSNLSSYIDGALTDCDAEKIKNHLDGCKECRAEYEKLMLIMGVLSDESIKAPEGYMASLKAKIAAEETSKKGFFGYVNYKVLSAVFAVFLLAVSFKTPLYDNLFRINDEKYNSVVTDYEDATKEKSSDKASKKVSGNETASSEDGTAEQSISNEKVNAGEEKNKNFEKSTIGSNLPKSKTKSESAKENISKENNTKEDISKENIVSEKSKSAGGTSKSVKNDSENAKIEESTLDSDYFSNGVSPLCADESDEATGYDKSKNIKEESVNKESENTAGINSVGADSSSSVLRATCDEVFGYAEITVYDKEEVLSVLSKYNINHEKTDCVLKYDEYTALKSLLSDCIISCSERIDGANEIAIQIFFK